MLRRGTEAPAIGVMLRNGALDLIPATVQQYMNSHDGQITLDEILTAVANALDGCPAAREPLHRSRKRADA